MIYLDNAATTMRKPQAVIDAVVGAMGSLGNAGRGAGAGAMGAARVIHECRERVAGLLGCPSADHVAFAPNSTEALNCVINGIVGAGDRVVTTVLEHNSVLRPLNRLAAERGVSVAHAGCDALGRLDMDELSRLVVPGTRAVVVTAASNVTGNVVDVAAVARIAHAAGALCVVDASQAAGLVPIDMAEQGLDVVCFTGHKALMGPQGTGGAAVMPGVDVAPWNVGGTGVHSFDEQQPLGWPTRLEAGTLKKADTLEALADMMEFDADQKATFLATVERYNGLVAAGEDTDFGKPAYRLSDVGTAPFYAARIGGELLVTIHGVITDVNSQPLKNDGTPIEGLYVCGNDQGGFYPHNYPSNFTGINAGRTATFARIAAKHALGVE